MSGNVEAVATAPRTELAQHRLDAVRLFLALLAAQATLLTLSPILTDIAREFGVATATVGQLRAVSGLVAGLTALRMVVRPPGIGLKRMLLWGLGLLALGSLLSALAPNLGVLVLAQLPVGIGLAIVLVGGLAAADRWSGSGDRAHLLSWALAGQPAAWIVGMPVVGLVGDVDWRYSWIAVPFVATVVAAAVLLGRADTDRCEPALRLRELRSDRGLLSWSIGELLAFCGWAGTLVYSGALFVESHDVSLRMTGFLLGAVAVIYIPGNMLFRRWAGGSARPLLIALVVAMAVAVSIYGGVRPSVAFSFGALGVLAFLAGGRTIIGSAFGLDAAGDRKLAAMGLRTAALQFGYLFGSFLGGIALDLGGYAALGATLAVFFALAAVPHVVSQRSSPVSVRAI